MRRVRLLLMVPVALLVAGCGGAPAPRTVPSTMAPSARPSSTVDFSTEDLSTVNLSTVEFSTVDGAKLTGRGFGAGGARGGGSNKGDNDPAALGNFPPALADRGLRFFTYSYPSPLLTGAFTAA